MLVVLLLAVLTFFLWECFVFYRRRSQLPPGPFPVPLLGNLVNEIKMPETHVGLKRLTAKFGNVFTVHLPYPVVNIVDFETIRDTFRGNDVTGRMKSVMTDDSRLCENGGIVAADGPGWVEQRKFAISTLRDFGMGKNLMEQKVQLSVQNMIDFIAKQDLDNVDLLWPIQLFVSNIINEFLYGFQYPYEDCEKLRGFVLNLKRAIDAFSSSIVVPIVALLPWTRHLPVVNTYYRKYVDMWKMTIEDFVVSQVNEVKYDPNEEPICFVQAFLKNNKDQRKEQLMACCSDIFLAGQETTTTTLRWAVLLMAAYPEVQEKLRKEINANIDRGHIACMADKSKMPFANAVLNEVQRYSNVVAPQPGLYHRTTVDTEIAGHHVPADTLVNGDIHQMMKSDPVFVEPDRFLPERYLAEDGVTLRKELVERTIPFGIGKRQCAGEGLARAELFIGLVTLVQNFRILPLPGTTIDTEPIYTFVHFPKPHNYRMERI